MKKYFGITIALILIFSVLTSVPIIMKKSIPMSPPSISVTYNENKIETARSDFNWFDKEKGGNTWFGDDAEVKKLKVAAVKKGEEIKFVFNTLGKQPNKTTVRLITPNRSSKVTGNTNSFNVPKETGEYMFLISGDWDETHSIGYYIKINVI